MLSEEEIKKLLELRGKIEDRIKQLEDEINYFKTILQIIDKLIRQGSITTASTLVQKEEKDYGKLLETREIRSKDGNVVGYAEIYEYAIKLKPKEPIDPEKAPFKRFFKEKILEAFRKEDLEKVKKGELSRDEVLNYEIVKNNEGKVVEILIENYGSDERLREILRSARWTFERLLAESKETKQKVEKKKIEEEEEFEEYY